jgi:hypothetical protein
LNNTVQSSWPKHPRRHLIIALLALALAIPLLAQSSLPTLVANRNVNVYDAPRNGLFCRAGDKIGVVQAGSEIADYAEIKSYCGFVNRFDYLQITYRHPDGKKEIAYINRKNGDGSDRFSAKPKVGA